MKVTKIDNNYLEFEEESVSINRFNILIRSTMVGYIDLKTGEVVYTNRINDETFVAEKGWVPCDDDGVELGKIRIRKGYKAACIIMQEQSRGDFRYFPWDCSSENTRDSVKRCRINAPSMRNAAAKAAWKLRHCWKSIQN